MGKVFVGECLECGNGFKVEGTGASKRKYCLTCRPVRQANRKPHRYCQLKGCTKTIPVNKRASAKYCCRDHAQKAAQARFYAREAEKTKIQSLFKNPDMETYVKQERQGEVYERLKSDQLTLDMLLSGKVTASAVAIQMNITTAAVTRAMQAILSEKAIANQRAEWSRTRYVQAMLPVSDMQALRELGMSGKGDTEEFNDLLTHLVHAYSVFSRFFFQLEGKRPIIKNFHLRWIRSVIRAWATGGKQLILSPPRHGKSEMLIRFVIWFIVMDPNIRIGWFCASRDVAELMLGAVKDHLENNERLIRATLPPGELYDPGLKSGRPWSKKEIKVAQQSHVGQKSSSLLALGLTSKFLSRDMDLIIIDDPEDFDSTNEEAQRKKARNKLAEVGTRKEEHTAEVYISSRQHPDDIPNHLLALEGTLLAWEQIVDSAHDLDCALDPDDFDIHVDCMLFPEVRSYRWLMEKKLEMESLGIPHAFPMRYLNLPIPEDGQVFNMELIRENALNRERGLGLEGLPLGHVAAGLDPSARGIQASFMWHYANGKMSMVDMDDTQSGGQDGAVRIIREWYHLYTLTLWFYETNSQQVDFYNNIKKQVQSKPCHICGQAHSEIQIKDFQTGQNKKDPELGISAMAPRYHDGRIDLPFGTNEARRKVNKLLRQLELWTVNGVENRKAKTDIKMASWFPYEHFVKMERGNRTPESVVQKEGSYRGIQRMGTVPWAETVYPYGG